MADESAARRRLEVVRSRIRDAALRAGRDPEEILLVAVSKSHAPEEILELASAGQRVFAENRVQEAAVKVPRVISGWSGPPLSWRMVGHLQRNKVRSALQVFGSVDSVDSLRLLEELARELRGRAGRLPVLLEFNCSGEAAKSGFSPEACAELGARLSEMEDVLDVQGLMTIAPLADRAEAARPAFRRLRDLREELAGRLGRPLPHLSMGMSGDLEVGIEEGATMVRVGTALFGPRE